MYICMLSVSTFITHACVYISLSIFEFYSGILCFIMSFTPGAYISLSLAAYLLKSGNLGFILTGQTGHIKVWISF